MNRLFHNKVVKNAGWIIGCKIAQSVLSLIISMITARYLGPSNYGVINYAISIAAFMVPITELGLSSVLVQAIIEGEDSEDSIIGTSLVLSFVSSIVCIVLVYAFVSLANTGEKETIIVCVLYSVMLSFQALELIRLWFQAKYLSKYPSIISLIAYVVVSIYKVFLLISEKSVYWFAVSYALDYMLIAFMLIAIYLIKFRQKMSFSFITAKHLWNKSQHYILSSLMVTIFAQTDRIMIKLMLNDSMVGYYSAAVTCAGISSFVFAAIFDSARPMIFEHYKTSIQKFENSIITTYSIVIYLALAQSVVMTVFSSWIIELLYGTAYAKASEVLRLIVWYSTFSYLGGVRNIWILANNLQKYLWKINLLGAFANVVLNYFLIPSLGIMGAALASLITQFFTNVITGYIFKPIIKNNELMLKSLNPYSLINTIKAKK